VRFVRAVLAVGAERRCRGDALAIVAGKRPGDFTTSPTTPSSPTMRCKPRRHKTQLPLHRSSVDCVDVHISEVENRKTAVLPLKCEEQIGPPEQHSFRTSIDQSPSRPKEDTPLGIRDATNRRHRAVVCLHLLNFITLGGKHRRRGNRAIKSCFHDHPSTDDPNCLVGALCDRRVHCREGIEERNWRNCLQLANAEVTTHRGHGSDLCTRCLQSSQELGKHLCLLLRVAAYQITHHLAHVSMSDCEV